jgi:anti-anti-sigma factor
MNAIGAIKVDGFSAECEHLDSSTVVRMTGIADMAVHDPIARFLDAVHQEIRSDRGTELVIDLTELLFMSSNCLCLLVRLLRRVEDLPALERYKLRFLAHSARRWQSRSIAALHAFAPNLVATE